MVRGVVTHAILQRTRGREPADNRIEIYRPPEREARLFADLQARAERGSAEVVLRGRLMQALTEQPPCTAELLAEGVAWATQGETAPAERPEDEREWNERTRHTVAALVLRDGAPATKAEHGGWARSLLTEVTKHKADARGTVQQLPYNVRAIAAVGLLAAYCDNSQPATLEPLLHVAVQHDTGMASVLRAEVGAQRSVPPELLRALMRLGLVSAIYTLPNRDEVDGESVEDYGVLREAEETARKGAERSRLECALTAELQWLGGGGPEPAWPELPDPMPPKERSFISVGQPRPRRAKLSTMPRERALDSAAAARWLSLAHAVWRKDAPERLRALIRHCWSWTANANGADCAPDEEAGEHAFEWNQAYFSAATAAGATLGDAGLREYVLDPVSRLPNERYFDAVEAVLHEIDPLWLNDELVLTSSVVMVRETIMAVSSNPGRGNGWRLSALRAWNLIWLVPWRRCSWGNTSLAPGRAVTFTLLTPPASTCFCPCSPTWPWKREAPLSSPVRFLACLKLSRRCIV